MKTKNLLFAGAIALSTVMSPMAAMISATPVLAAEHNVVNRTDHAYHAYQIFSGTQGENGVLGQIKWGDGVNQEVMNDLLANSEYFKNGDNPMSAAEVADVLGKCTENSPEVKEFVKIADQAKSDTYTQIAANQKTVDLREGYYLLVDVTNTDGVESESKNKSLLQVSGGEIEIRKKTDVPTFEKKVLDKNDTSGDDLWEDSADHDFEDDVQFKLRAHLPANYDDYDTYKLVFHDSLDANAFDNPTGFKVYVADPENPTNRSEIKSDLYKISTPVETDNGERQFSITIENVKGIEQAVAGGIIEVEYTAKLKDTAELNYTDENKNTAYLEYSNNPNSEGEGETGKTPNDTVRVFTYSLNVNKKNPAGDALAGAGFTLSKEIKQEDGTTKYEPVGDEITGTNMTTFVFKGLDDGNYKLEETTVPSGYNKIDPIYFTITAEHEQVSNDPKLTKLHFTPEDEERYTFNTTLADGSSTNVINSQNAPLPETGGMGTTLIYTAGGLLVAGAAITYVTNKRMRKEN